MNEKNLGQKCSKCDGFMEKFKIGFHPVCLKCQRENSRKRTALNALKRKGIILDTSWSSWVCSCEEGFIYDKTVELCLMGCGKERPLL